LSLHFIPEGWGSSEDHVGVPANQLDMAHTINLFSHVALRNLELLGYRPTPQECEDYHHLWRYTGWILGTNIELLPESYPEEIRLYSALVKFYRTPKPISKVLVEGLVTSLSYHPPVYHSTEFLRAMSRHLIGDEPADLFRDILPPIAPEEQKTLTTSVSITYWDVFLQQTVPFWLIISVSLQKLFLAISHHSLVQQQARLFTFTTAK
jgi:hypothetical protein